MWENICSEVAKHYTLSLQSLHVIFANITRYLFKHNWGRSKTYAAMRGFEALQSTSYAQFLAEILAYIINNV